MANVSKDGSTVSVNSPNRFRLDVIARGNHIVVKVDDKIVADYTDPKSTYTKGRIGLHGLWINKLEIKELQPTEPNTPEPLAFIDTDGDCRWHRDGKRITITAPAGDHHFSAKKANLPRLLQEVEGDFVAEVTLPPLTLVPVSAPWPGASIS